MLSATHPRGAGKTMGPSPTVTPTTPALAAKLSGGQELAPHPGGENSCRDGGRIPPAAGFVKQLIKDNAINYSLMK